MADTTRTLTGGPLDGETIDLALVDMAEFDGVALEPLDGGLDSRTAHYVPGPDPDDGRLYYDGQTG